MNFTALRISLERFSPEPPLAFRRQVRQLACAAMNVTLLKALVALVPVCILLLGSVISFSREKTAGAFLPVLVLDVSW